MVYPHPPSVAVRLWDARSRFRDPEADDESGKPTWYNEMRWPGWRHMACPPA